MEKLKQFVLDFVKSNKFKTFLWQTVNGFIVILMAGITEIDWQYVPIIYAFLNGLTKHINQTYLGRDLNNPKYEAE
jgi:hypothetical protein